MQPEYGPRHKCLRRHTFCSRRSFHAFHRTLSDIRDAICILMGRRDLTAVMADLKALVLGRAGVFQASTCASISKAVVFCHKLRFASPQMEEVRECPFFSNVLRALRWSSVQLWCDFRPMTFPVAIHRKPGAQAGHFLIVRKHGWKGTLLLCSPHMVNPQIHANSNNRDNVSRLVT